MSQTAPVCFGKIIFVSVAVVDTQSPDENSFSFVHHWVVTLHIKQGEDSFLWMKCIIIALISLWRCDFANKILDIFIEGLNWAV